MSFNILTKRRSKILTRIIIDNITGPVVIHAILYFVYINYSAIVQNELFVIARYLTILKNRHKTNSWTAQFIITFELVPNFGVLYCFGADRWHMSSESLPVHLRETRQLNGHCSETIFKWFQDCSQIDEFSSSTGWFSSTNLGMLLNER